MIAIAGAGIGGLVLSRALQARGVDVLMLEEADALRSTGAGISLWPNALAALDVVGLGDLVRDIGYQVSSGGLLLADGAAGPTVSAGGFERALGAPLVCVDRGELVTALAAGLAPGTVVTGAGVAGVEVKDQAVVVRLTKGGTVEASALVGADGFRSVVAAVLAGLAGPLAQSYSGYTGWRSVADVAVEPRGLWGHFVDGHEIGWLPLPRGRTYWFATAVLPEAAELQGSDSAYLRSMLVRCPEPVHRLLQATDLGQLVRTDIVDRALPPRWHHGRVALLGDAAHPMRPHLGQGGCQAIEDAAVLAQCLAGGGEPASAFRRYAAVRQRRARMVRWLSRQARLTYPAGARSRISDRLVGLLQGRSVDPLLRALAPIASYPAGMAAVTVPSGAPG